MTPEGDISVGIEGSQFCTNPLPPSPCRCSKWITSPLEHPLRNSRLSLTQSHLTCWCPPSFAPVQPVVSTDTHYPDHPSLALLPCFHPWHIMTLISCVFSYTSQVQTFQVFHLLAYPKDLQHRLRFWKDEGISCLMHRSGNV